MRHGRRTSVGPTGQYRAQCGGFRSPDINKPAKLAAAHRLIRQNSGQCSEKETGGYPYCEGEWHLVRIWPGLYKLGGIGQRNHSQTDLGTNKAGTLPVASSIMEM